MEIKVPLSFNDQVMTSGRVFSNINSIEGEIDINGNVSHLIYTTDKVSRCRLQDFIRPTQIEDKDFKTINLQPSYGLNEEVLCLNSSYGNIGILVKENIVKIEFNVSLANKLFWYRTKNRSIDRYETYKNVEDFIRRTKPKQELKENQKYIFTDYSIQQNTLVAVDVEKVSDTHFKIIKGYDSGEKVRGSKLFNSHESFIRHMTAQL